MANRTRNRRDEGIFGPLSHIPAIPASFRQAPVSTQEDIIKKFDYASFAAKSEDTTLGMTSKLQTVEFDSIQASNEIKLESVSHLKDQASHSDYTSRNESIDDTSTPIKKNTFAHTQMAFTQASSGADSSDMASEENNLGLEKLNDDNISYKANSTPKFNSKSQIFNNIPKAVAEGNVSTSLDINNSVELGNYSNSENLKSDDNNRVNTTSFTSKVSKDTTIYQKKDTNASDESRSLDNITKDKPKSDSNITQAPIPAAPPPPPIAKKASGLNIVKNKSAVSSKIMSEANSINEMKMLFSTKLAKLREKAEKDSLEGYGSVVFKQPVKKVQPVVKVPLQPGVIPSAPPPPLAVKKASSEPVKVVKKEVSFTGPKAGFTFSLDEIKTQKAVAIIKGSVRTTEDSLDKAQKALELINKNPSLKKVLAAFDIIQAQLTFIQAQEVKAVEALKDVNANELAIKLVKKVQLIKDEAIKINSQPEIAKMIADKQALELAKATAAAKAFAEAKAAAEAKALAEAQAAEAKALAEAKAAEAAANAPEVVEAPKAPKIMIKVAKSLASGSHDTLMGAIKGGIKLKPTKTNEEKSKDVKVPSSQFTWNTSMLKPESTTINVDEEDDSEWEDAVVNTNSNPIISQVLGPISQPLTLVVEPIVIDAHKSISKVFFPEDNSDFLKTKLEALRLAISGDGNDDSDDWG